MKASAIVSSLSDVMLRELADTALGVERLYDGLPQDIEWAFSEGRLQLLQSRPITNLPVQPIEVEWEPPPPARYMSRRQIVENMPDPICPLFDELYLTEGLESARKGASIMIGGGPLFMSVNGYAFQRFDFPQVHRMKEAKKEEDRLKAVSEAAIEAAERGCDARKGEAAAGYRAAGGPRLGPVCIGTARGGPARVRSVGRDAGRPGPRA